MSDSLPTNPNDDAEGLSVEQYRTLFHSIDSAFCVIKVLFAENGGAAYDYRFVDCNPAFERHTGLVNAVGKTIRELVPGIDESWFPIYGNVVRTGQPVRFENHDPALRRWFDAYAMRLGAAEDGEVGILFTDITSRREAEEALHRAEERERARLTDIFMRAPAFMAALRGPQHIFEMANTPYLQLVAGRDIIGKSVAEALPEVVGQGFVTLLDRVYSTGEAFVGTDVPVLLQMRPDSALEERFLDFTYQPLYEEDGSVSGILVHGVDLTDRKRLEQERERLLAKQGTLLAEAQARVERETLLNQIGAAVRTMQEPDEILQTAVSLLGKGLSTDRCYFVRYNQSRNIARISHDWHREGLGITSLAGRTFEMSIYSVDRHTGYLAGSTHVVEDAVAFDPEDAAPLLAVNIHALLRVPIDVGDQMTAIAVAMSEGPRQWTQDEVRLVENVASLLRSALESLQIQQRERNIATHLQEALQPPVPATLPGLSLASHYRPALAEASVGGDFFDVFPVRDGEWALVVADLSGKGLAAASQVSTVRNMLRYALYSTRSLAEAVTGLHRALVEHDLLAGFATLFLAVFDEKNRTLVYVNCGQEPGLIWRAATGEIERMPPTGPVLGGFGDGDYEEVKLSLSEGDVLALFTDGLTEVGPSRKNLLEIDGVSDVLQNCCSQKQASATSPHSVVDCLIAGVDDFARGGTRDDIALLVGIVTHHSHVRRKSGSS